MLVNRYHPSIADDRPTVLFVCVHNAGRSQMAGGLLEKLAGDRVRVRTAGSAPADEINPVAVEAMAEVGVDLGAELPKLLTTDAVREADVGDHDGLWRRLPGLSRQTLRGLGPGGPGGQGPRRRPGASATRSSAAYGC